MLCSVALLFTENAQNIRLVSFWKIWGVKAFSMKYKGVFDMENLEILYLSIPNFLGNSNST